MIKIMKKFEMPKLELIGLSKDLAFAGASDKDTGFEFATTNTPKTTWSLLGKSKTMSLALQADLDSLSTDAS